VADSGQVQDIRVSVDIAHSWIGDLRVRLTAPDGISVLLHDRSGSSQDNIRQTLGVPIEDSFTTSESGFAQRSTSSLC